MDNDHALAMDPLTAKAQVRYVSERAMLNSQ